MCHLAEIILGPNSTIKLIIIHLYIKFKFDKTYSVHPNHLYEHRI